MMKKEISIHIPSEVQLSIPVAFLLTCIYDYLAGASKKRIALNTALHIGAAGLGCLFMLKVLTCGDGVYTGELCYEKDGTPIWKLFSKDGKCEFITGPDATCKSIIHRSRK